MNKNKKQTLIIYLDVFDCSQVIYSMFASGRCSWFCVTLILTKFLSAFSSVTPPPPPPTFESDAFMGCGFLMVGNSESDYCIANYLKANLFNPTTKNKRNVVGGDTTKLSYPRDNLPSINMFVTFNNDQNFWRNFSSNVSYVVNVDRHQIVQIDSNGILHTFIGGAGDDNGGYNGDQLALRTKIKSPTAVTVSPDGNIYFSDSGNNLIRKVSHQSSVVSTVAGNKLMSGIQSNVSATSASLRNPTQMWINADGDIFFIDFGHGRICKIDSETQLLTTVSINGYEELEDCGDSFNIGSLSLTSLWGDSFGNLYVSGGATIFSINLSDKIVRVIAGTGCGLDDNSYYVFSGELTLVNNSGTSVSLSKINTITGTVDKPNVLFLSDYLKREGVTFVRVHEYHVESSLINTVFSVSWRDNGGDDVHISNDTEIIWIISSSIFLLLFFCNCCYRYNKNCLRRTLCPSSRLDDPTDVFLTHDWGEDELGRKNHDRVALVNARLNKLGLRTWFDSDKLKGNVLEQMTAGIDNTQCVVVFITERYMSKVNNGDGRDNCQFEFDYAFRTLGPTRIIAVVMEARMRDTQKWLGVFGGAMGGMLYIDMVEDGDETVAAVCATLKKRIIPITQLPDTRVKIKPTSKSGEKLSTNKVVPVTDDVESGESVSPISIIKTDVFLTHDWGKDELGRSNHDRVGQVNTELKSLGVVTWFDSEQLNGRVSAQMTAGIDNTKVVVVFVTENYMHKVNNGDGRDNCQFEFNYAFRTLGPSRIVAVIMEPRMRDKQKWTGVFGGSLMKVRCVDLVQNDATYEDFQDKCKLLRDLVIGATVNEMC